MSTSKFIVFATSIPVFLGKGNTGIDNLWYQHNITMYIQTTICIKHYFNVGRIQMLNQYFFSIWDGGFIFKLLPLYLSTLLLQFPQLYSQRVFCLKTRHGLLQPNQLAEELQESFYIAGDLEQSRRNDIPNYNYSWLDWVFIIIDYELLSGVRAAVPALPTDPRGGGLQYHGRQLERRRLAAVHHTPLPAQCRRTIFT